MQALKNRPLKTRNREPRGQGRAVSDRADELPVLSAVVRSGNASIIQSHRLGHQVLDELETLRLMPKAPLPEESVVSWQDIPVRFSALDDLTDNFDETIDFEQPDLASGIDASFSQRDTEATMNNDDIELMVEALVERHVSELRRDIRSLLARVRQAR